MVGRTSLAIWILSTLTRNRPIAKFLLLALHCFLGFPLLIYHLVITSNITFFTSNKGAS